MNNFLGSRKLGLLVVSTLVSFVSPEKKKLTCSFENNFRFLLISPKSASQIIKGTQKPLADTWTSFSLLLRYTVFAVFSYSLRQLLKTVHVALSGLRKPCPDGTSGICDSFQSTGFELEKISAKSVTFFMEVQRNVLVILNLSNWCCFSKTPASFSPELQIFGPIRCKLFSWAPNIWTNQIQAFLLSSKSLDQSDASFSPELQIFGPIRCKLFSWAPNLWTNQMQAFLLSSKSLDQSDASFSPELQIFGPIRRWLGGVLISEAYLKESCKYFSIWNSSICRAATCRQ